MKRLIKNYTTEIPVERTVSEIQKVLSENGASAIAIEYQDGAITDIFFKVIRNGQGNCSTHPIGAISLI
jgi:hypothetical protein